MQAQSTVSQGQQSKTLLLFGQDLFDN